MSEMAAVPGVTLCVVNLTYSDHAAIEAAMGRHMAWMTEQYANGTLLASGRKDPWTGGILLMVGGREAVEAAVAGTPFVAEGIATAEVVPFVLGLAAKPLADLLA